MKKMLIRYPKQCLLKISGMSKSQKAYKLKLSTPAAAKVLTTSARQGPLSVNYSSWRDVTEA
jgi:hypothetical protein